MNNPTGRCPYCGEAGAPRHPNFGQGYAHGECVEADKRRIEELYGSGGPPINRRERRQRERNQAKRKHQPR